MYVKAEHTLKEIALRFGISATRCYQIVYANRDLITIDKDWEKNKRVHWLKRQIVKNDSTKKDTADLQEQLRKELEGDKPLVDQSKHYSFALTVEQYADKNEIQTTRSPKESIRR